MDKPTYYIVTLNGQHYGTTKKKDVAEEVAEKLWEQGKGATAVIRADADSIVCEFEI